MISLKKVFAIKIYFWIINIFFIGLLTLIYFEIKNDFDKVSSDNDKIAIAFLNNDSSFLREYIVRNSLTADNYQFINNNGLIIFSFPNEIAPKNIIKYTDITISRYSQNIGIIRMGFSSKVFGKIFFKPIILGYMTIFIFTSLFFSILSLSKYKRSLLKVIDQLKKWSDHPVSNMTDLQDSMSRDPVASEIFNLLNKGMVAINKVHDLQADVKVHEAVNLISRQVAHDIRSPLSALNIITQQITNLNLDQKEIISASLKRINEISNDLLLKPNPLNIISTISNGINTFVNIDQLLLLLIKEKKTEYVKFKNVIIEYSSDSHTHNIYTTLNSKEFLRALSNLINNSIEALPNQKGIVTIKLSIFDQIINITIADNGIGISEENLAKIGQYGFTINKNVTESGHGLGLWHAKKYVESEEGKINISSELNVGTTIEISLPLKSKK